MRVRYLTYPEAAIKARCHPAHLRRAVMKGQIAVKKVGHRTFLDPASFSVWLERYELTRYKNQAVPIFAQ